MSDWISVKDRLPEICTGVLCYVIVPDKGRAATSIRILQYYKASRSWNCDGMIVTHWMPMPEPPKEDTSNGTT